MSKASFPFTSSTKSRAHRLPIHWPRHLQYLTSSHYHSSVPPAIVTQILGSSSQANKDLLSNSNRRPKVVIQAISSDSHPAKGQFGLFAAQKIPPNSHIVNYIGEIHVDDRPDSDYDLCLLRLPDGDSVGIDASTMGNEARFVNDYRGISNKANAAFVNDRTASGELKMSIWSSNGEIEKGQEILVSYGKSWWRSRSVEHG
ncbi:hypothetical protein GALMADRAFT_233228 [Galerina marginata CBS 339.88]|uniref:SET domain-containing protein n=1 Tax=Galerina marginata (strain CBS 339.88) TaxID=685588 RepID=A0A067TNQ9_GALM3|nr:hypothetical protein GALMADRAFT_233228 [Galerina marginata CBS 339.88]